MRALRGFLAAAALMLAFGLLAGTAAAQERLRLTVRPPKVTVRLGGSFGFDTRVTNTERTEVSGLIAHLNIVSLRRDVYVDPEDWSPSRTKYLPALGPGESARVSWKVKAVSGGDFAVYAVVLPESPAAPASQPPVVSPTTKAHVTERRNLNPGGALPLTLAVPGAIGLLALALRMRRRT